MDKKKYYVDTEGNDDEAYAEAIELAVKLSNEDKSIKRIILLAISKNKVDWLTRLYGENMVKMFRKGTACSDNEALIKIETRKTYKDINSNDIVVTLGLDTEDLNKIEDFYCVKAIIAIPWQKHLLEKWIKSGGPIDIRSKQQPKTFDEPPCVVKKALEQLTYTINLSTGIGNPHDNQRAKTFVSALFKYNYDLDINKIHGYLVRELNWASEHAEDFEKLITTLQAGNHFQGSEKTGLQNYVKEWEKKCGE